MLRYILGDLLVLLSFYHIWLVIWDDLKLVCCLLSLFVCQANYVMKTRL